MTLLLQGTDLTAAWGNTHNIHPLGLLMLVIACSGLLMLPRRSAFAPIILILFFVTTAQRLVIAGLDFPFLRILILLGMFRVVSRGETRGFKVTSLDWIVIWWGIASYLTGVIRESLYVYGLGWTVDNLGAYFLCRVMLRNREELYHFAKWVALLTIPITVFFIVEKSTGYNLFSVFGGVSEKTGIREGKLRCTGTFQHPILAGCFFAGLFPMLAMLWAGTGHRKSKPNKFICGASMVGAVIVVICCASSTPMMSVMAGVGALILFRLPWSVVYLRWGSVFGLICLHMIMTKPVWHLISRIDLTGGSTGYHRYRLIDATIRNFHEWALVGVSYTWHWGPQLYDITGHYVLQCTDGGLVKFLLFIILLLAAFRCVRQVIKYSPNSKDAWLAWTVGAGLFANCVSFLGVSYFGKPLFLLMLQMAVLTSLAFEARREWMAVRRQALLCGDEDPQEQLSQQPQPEQQQQLVPS